MIQRTKKLTPFAELLPELVAVEEARGYFFDGSEGPGYQAVLESMEYDIILQYWASSAMGGYGYHGDAHVLFQDQESNAYGLLIFGFGSCSGCDALAACATLQELETLREGMCRKIWWGPSATELLDYIVTKDWKGEYSGHVRESRNFVAQVTELLARLIALDAPETVALLESMKRPNSAQMLHLEDMEGTKGKQWFERDHKWMQARFAKKPRRK